MRAYGASVARRPDFANAHYNLGLTVQKLGDARAAKQAFQEVLRLTPNDADAWNKLGAAQLDGGELSAAKASHERALELNPRSADAYNGLGLACMDAGSFEDAARHYRKAIELEPTFTKVYLNLAKSHRFCASDRSDLELIKSVFAQPGLTSNDRVDIHFALGKTLDDCCAYDEAFHHFEQANRHKWAKIHGDRDGLKTWITAIISIFNRAFFAARENYGVSSKRPVFIVGMPRSGTTLVEQIIASHPQAFGAGELPKIGALSLALGEQSSTGGGYPAYAPELTDDAVRQAAEDYLGFLNLRSETAARITDKLPANYTQLGLIALMFPNAHVVDCRREPLDVALSIYFSQFVGDHPFAYDLEDIAFEYGQYQRLMSHWNQVLPISVHGVDYEALVANPEEISRALVESCGLEWDDRCLRFYENSRPVHTASNWQVRQPIYPRSVGRWKNYEKYLGKVMRVLG